MRYKKAQKSGVVSRAMAVLVVAVLAVLFVLASSQVFKSSEHSGRGQPQSAQGRGHYAERRSDWR